MMEIRPNNKQRYFEEWSEQAKNTYVNESDSDIGRSNIKGTKGVHGSHCVQTSEGLLDALKLHKQKNEQRGHSIGYNQNSVDSNVLTVGGKYVSYVTIDTRCQNMKENIGRSRPTSSSSSFMYVNPLLGTNQKYNLRFQPLDEDIPEEKERGRLKRTLKNKKNKIKKKKKKVIRWKPAEIHSQKDNEESEEHEGTKNLIALEMEKEVKNDEVEANSVNDETPVKKFDYNILKYDEADSQFSVLYLDTFSEHSEQTPEEIDERFLAPIYKGNQFVYNVVDARENISSSK